MKYWVGVTDNEWFAFLSRLRPDEVNFWQPSGRAPFVGLEPGAPFLFKLKRPFNHVAGGGYFVKFSSLPLFDGLGHIWQQEVGTTSLWFLRVPVFGIE